jgi:hypothetical protein
VIDPLAIRQLAQIVIRGVTAGRTVEIDGLGSFHPDRLLGFRFEAALAPKVFIAHVSEDAPAARRIYDALANAGFSPWLDKKKLLAGQNWPRAIESAIETSDFFLACFSENSVNKRGGFQAEIRYALDCARRMPLDQIFVVPVRLNGCRVPRAVNRELHQVDLFPDWNRGMETVVSAIANEAAKRGFTPVFDTKMNRF